MTYQKLTITATGGLQAYAISWPALEKEHVKASVDNGACTFTVSGDIQAGTATATFSSPTFVGGEIIEIWRETGTEPLVDFQSGAPILESDLDTANLQHLYLQEEWDFILADEYQALAEKGQPSGYAGLDAQGKLALEQMGGDDDATTQRYLRDDGVWEIVVGSGGSGSGNVTGPLSSENQNLAQFSGTSGQLLADAGLTLAETLDRANHTGTQDVSTITGLADVATSGDYNDLINTPTPLAGLDDLPDVNAPTPADGDVLTWDDTAGEWIAAVGGGGGTGSVTGPVTSVVDAVAVWSNSGGTGLKNTTVRVDTSGDIVLDTPLATVDGVDVSELQVDVTALEATAPTADQKAALAGTSGAPSVSNKYVTDADTRLDPFVGDDNNSGTPELAGLVPAPAHGDWYTSKKFLNAAGEWVPINLSWLVGTLDIGFGGTGATTAVNAAAALLPQSNNLGSNIAPAGNKGHILYRTNNVAGGGLQAWGALLPGADDTVLIADSTAGPGVRWGAIPGGSGTVAFGGPSPNVGDIPEFGDTTGDLIVNSNFNSANLLTAFEKSAVGGASGTSVGPGNKLIDEADDRVLPFLGADQSGLSAGAAGLVPAASAGDWTTSKKFLSANGDFKQIAGAYITGTGGAVAIAAGGTAATNANDAASNILPTSGITGTGSKGHIVVRTSTASGSGGLAWDKLAPGSDGQVLRADSTSTYGIKWDDAAASATGSDTEVQYNNSGALGAYEGFRFDDANFRLSLGAAGVAVPLRLESQAAAPASPLQGDLWTNSSTGRLIYRDASASRVVETTNNKAIASGYAGLDAVAQVPTANARAREWDLQRHSVQARHDGTMGFQGFGSAPQLAGTQTALADADGRWVTFTSGATAGNACGVETPHFSYVQSRWFPELVVRIKTPSSLTNAKIWIGFESDALGDVTVPSGKNIAAFRYINGTDTGWTTYTCDGTTSTTVNTNQISIAAGTVYEMRIRFLSGKVEFWVNTVKAATDHTATLPGSSNELGYLCLNTAATAAAQTIHIARINLEHS